LRGDLIEIGEPHPCIRHIGGNSGQLQCKHTQAQVIQSIEHGLFAYSVGKDVRALKLEVCLAPNGRKYLKAPSDGDQLKLLLNLREYPKPATI
jgi:hypothetical protein